MGKLIDESGKIYGFLQVLERGKNNKQNKPRWKCKCLKCGNIIEIEATRLRNKKEPAIQCRECGYKERNKKVREKLHNNILNERFGHLYVIKKDENSGGTGHNVKWKCRCDCGNIIYVSTFCLKTRGQKTCGDPKCHYRNNVLSEIKTEDLTDMVFGDLTVIKRSKKAENSHFGRNSFWHCKCICGKELNTSRTSLIKGKRKCCNSCLKGKSLGEKCIEKILLDNNIEFQTELCFTNLKGINNGYVRFDFGIYKNNKLIRLIEFDGEFHYISTDLWNSEVIKQNDIIKNEYCIKNNIPLVRIPDWERDNIDFNMLFGNDFLLQEQKIS